MTVIGSFEGSQICKIYAEHVADKLNVDGISAEVPMSISVDGIRELPR